VTSQNLWSRYDRHFVGITWCNLRRYGENIYRVILTTLNQLIQEYVRMIINLPTACIQAVADIYQEILPTRWRQKTATVAQILIKMTSLSHCVQGGPKGSTNSNHNICNIIYTLRNSRNTLETSVSFLLRDSASCGPVSVCLFVKSEFYRNSWMNPAGFGHGSFLPLMCVIFKNKSTSQQKFVHNSGLRQILASAYRLSKRVINLARERWTLWAW